MPAGASRSLEQGRSRSVSLPAKDRGQTAHPTSTPGTPTLGAQQALSRWPFIPCSPLLLLEMSSALC